MGDGWLAGLCFAVLVERGTNPTEFHYGRLRLREAGAQVTVVSLGRSEVELEDHSVGYADLSIEEMSDRRVDGIYIPGGLGPEKLRLNRRVIELVRNCHARGHICAAICHGQQVLISAGLMRGVHATAAWSMVDDLRAVGALVDGPSGVPRAVRDGSIVTAMFPRDLPAFFGLVFEALADLEGRRPPAGYRRRLAGRTWGIVVDDASDATQVQYLRLRIGEEGGQAVLLGRRAGQEVRLSSPAWEWGEMGWKTRIDRALPNPGVIGSCDTEAELDSQAIAADELDGLLLPGGLATWMIRGHPGLRALACECHRMEKPIAAVGRGLKSLLTTGLLQGRTVTCAPQMRDDVVQSLASIEYRDVPVVLDGQLLTGQGTEHLPQFVSTLVAAFGADRKLERKSSQDGDL
jgi:protease I